MSMDETSFPALTDGESTTDRGPQSNPSSDVSDPTIRGQAWDIIESVLDDATPQSEWARDQLRSQMESHPGNPERALLEHLIATRSITDEQTDEPGLYLVPEANLPTPDLPMPDEDYAEPVLFTRRSRRRIEAILGDRMLLTAFQPIHELASKNVIGAEALARFVSDDGASADHWFNEAAAVGLGPDLEFAALQAALVAAEQLPADIYVGLNLSPAACLDPRLRAFVDQSQLAVDRIVIELTERLAEDEYAPLVAALAPLRQRGLRVAVDGAGAGFGSMSQVKHLSPDIIKLDRSLIAGIDHAAGQQTLGAAMVEFSRQIGADLVAEGIETQAELTAVMELGMVTGQGYLLGRPSVQPLDWAAWRTAAGEKTSVSGSAGPAA
jgi:EAL domain-containing protein (putative c-di-GMP-specific phosphodiesterase class I)